MAPPSRRKVGSRCRPSTVRADEFGNFGLPGRITLMGQAAWVPECWPHSGSPALSSIVRAFLAGKRNRSLWFRLRRCQVADLDLGGRRIFLLGHGPQLNRFGVFSTGLPAATQWVQDFFYWVTDRNPMGSEFFLLGCGIFPVGRGP